jgi:mono/diheme cytochrome c family protein
MKHAIVLLYILIILNIANIATSYLSIKKDPVSMQDRQTIIRGGIVFNTYCVLCHGENADGNGRLSEGKRPPPANLTVSLLTDEMKEDIIRKGGSAVGRSPFMPPWGEELSNEQVRDLIYYLNVIKVKQ